MIKLASDLPKGNSNGLYTIADELIAKPKGVHAVVALIDCRKTTKNNDTGAIEPTIRIRRIEVVTDADKSLVAAVLNRALEDRTGQTALPLNIEKDMQAAFGKNGF